MRLSRPHVRLAGLAVPLAVIALAVVAGGATAHPAATTAAAPYRILVFGGFNGPIAGPAKAELAAIRAAAVVLNRQGGIRGRRVTVASFDDQLNPTNAVGELQQQLNGGSRPDLVFAGTTSNVALALLPLLSREKVISYALAGSQLLNDPDRYPYHFGVSPLSTVESGNAQSVSLVQHARARGWKKVGLLTANDALGKSLTDSTADAFKKGGITLVTDQYPLGALDMTPQLERLRSNNVDAVIFSAFGAPAGYVLESRRKIGWTDTPLVGDISASATNLAPLVSSPNSLRNVFLQAYQLQIYSAPKTRWPNLKSFLTAVKAQGAIKEPITLYANSYDFLMMIKEAAAQARSTSAEPLARALENFRYRAKKAAKGQVQLPWVFFGRVGQWGSYSYSSKNHFPLAKPALYRVVPYGNAVDGMIRPGA